MKEDNSKSIGYIKKKLAYFSYLCDFFKFKRLVNSDRSFKVRWQDRYPILSDKYSISGFDRHYVFHTAWAARILSKTNPHEHIDISSSLMFVSVVSAFIPVKFYDYHKINLVIDGLETKTADLNRLPFPDESIKSLSCMHVVEHVGLGRYGDTLDHEGDLKSIGELKRVLAKEGDLLFVVPIGQPKIRFNAHRIYSYNQIMQYFSPLCLKEFALIPDNPRYGGLLYDVSDECLNAQQYGCGCFWFKKE